MKYRLLLRNLALSALFSGLCVGLLLNSTDYAQVADNLERIRWGYVLAALGIYAAAMIVIALRWQSLLPARLPLIRLAHVINICNLVNATIPLRIGDLARIFFVTRVSMNAAGQPAGASGRLSGWSVLPTLAAERLLDILALALTLAITVLFLDVPASVVSGGVLLGLAALGGFGLLLIFGRRPTWVYRALDYSERRMPALNLALARLLVDRMLFGVRPLTTVHGLTRAAFFTALMWCGWLGAVWTLSFALPDLPHGPLTAAALTLATVGTTFSGIIPFTVANVGPFEAAVIFALALVNISQETALTYAVLLHSVVLFHSALWGVIGFLALGVSLVDLRRAASQRYSQPLGVPSAEPSPEG